MVRVNFNLRHKRNGELSPVNVVIRWNGKRLVYPSRERIDPSHWSNTTQRAKRTYSGASDFNVYLTNLTSDIEKEFRAFVQKSKNAPTETEFKRALDESFNRTAKDTPQTLFEFIDHYIDQSQTKVNPLSGRLIAKTSIKNYRTAFEQLRKFAKHSRTRIDFDSVDLVFYDKFTTFLTTQQGLAMNTVGKYLQTLKAFLRAAEESGIQVNPSYRSKRFKTPSELTNKIYLTESELTELFELDLSKNPRLEKARDLFLVGAWTGLRFGDFTNIQAEQIQGDRLRIRTSKTGISVVIPLHHCVRSIVSKYSGKYVNSLPPSISNQKMNAYLKEITKQLDSLDIPVMASNTVGGIRNQSTKTKAELITTHTARRSFATNMYRTGCPSRTIMAITGHKTESAFRAYIRLDSEEHADIIEMYLEKSHLSIAK